MSIEEHPAERFFRTERETDDAVRLAVDRAVRILEEELINNTEITGASLRACIGRILATKPR